MNAITAQRSRNAIALIGVLALVAIAMWPALSGSFIFDDYPIFADNKPIQVTDWSWQSWRGVWIWAHTNIQRPMAMFSYALNYALGGGTWGFKATNLAIHLLNTVLVAWFARNLLLAGWTKDTHVTFDERAREAKRWSLAVALLWAIHPLQVSSVMYVVQRMELLGFTFVLLALLAYWQARQRQLDGRPRAWLWLLLCAALTALGYLAKETAVLVPGYALLLELTVLRFKAATSLAEKSWKTLYLAGCLITLSLTVFYVIPHYASGIYFDGRDFTAWERVLTQLRVLPMYIGWSVLPLPNQLHFYYDDYIASTGWLSPASTLFGGLFLLALLVIGLAVRRRRPLIALGIGWFFVAHLLTSAPFSLELVFEHRNYPALFGIVLALVDMVRAATRRAHPRLPALFAVILVASLGFLTVLRAATWGNPLQLALTLAQDNPQSPRAAYDLATRYMLMSGGDPSSPLYPRTVAELEHAASLPKSSPLPDQALLLMAASGGVPLQQRWWDRFLHKLETRPMGPQERNALTHLASVRVDDGNTHIDERQLQKAYEIILRRLPNDSQLCVQYADLAALDLHDMPLAIRQLERAVTIEIGMPNYPKLLAGYLLDRHRAEEALAVMAKAEQLRPDLKNDPAWLSLREQASHTPSDAQTAPQLPAN